MYVEMKNSLTAVGIRIYDDSVTIIRKTLFTRHVRCRRQKMSERVFVLIACFVQRIHVLARD